MFYAEENDLYFLPFLGTNNMMIPVNNKEEHHVQYCTVTKVVEMFNASMKW